MSGHILIVEDESDVSALVAYHLTREGYRVRTAATGPEALRAVDVDSPDLVVLDWMLPGVSGIELLEELRRRGESGQIPVIMLTARSTAEDRLEGLRVGADDYIVKPFSAQELVLRVGAVLRRARQQPAAPRQGRVLRVGPFRLDVTAVRAHVGDRELTLTPLEFELLRSLMERRGRVQSREQLLADVWEVTARITTRTVDMHVQRLRAKLGEHAAWLETVRGFGYRFRSDEPSRQLGS